MAVKYKYKLPVRAGITEIHSMQPQATRRPQTLKDMRGIVLR